MNALKSCPSCASDKIVALKKYREENLSKCGNCALVFCTKIPTEIELREHYEHYGRNDYLSPITIKRYRELLQEFQKNGPGKKILDVGCGIGYFLDQAKLEGWDVYGTEFTDEAVKICSDKGISMYKGSLQEIDFGQLQFDVITSFEVLEHLQNPGEHVEKIASLLKPGGLFYLTTPNFDSLNRRILNKEWNVISYPEHLCYFNKKSLKRLFRSKGLKKQKLLTHGISPERLIRSKKKESMDFSASIRADETLRSSIEESKFLAIVKEVVNWKLNLFSLGETLKAWYVKS